MTPIRFVALVVAVVFLVVVLQPPPAEAIEPIFLGLIVSAGIVVLALLAVVVIANIAERQPRVAALEMASISTWTADLPAAASSLPTSAPSGAAAALETP